MVAAVCTVDKEPDVRASSGAFAVEAGPVSPRPYSDSTLRAALCGVCVVWIDNGHPSLYASRLGGSMFGLEMLDVAIGLTFVYLLLSLVSSAVREAWEAWSKSRAAFLERGLLALLESSGAQTDTAHQLVESLYNHPRIYGLYEGSYVRAGATRSAAEARRLPSYIAASTFSDALIDTVARRCQNVPSRANVIDRLRLGAEALDNESIRSVILSAINSSGGDTVAVRSAIEAWYNAGMDRVAGWYRRRTHWIVIGVATVITIGLNVNTITIFRALEQNPALRQSIVQQAGTTASATGPQAKEELTKLSLPIGWTNVSWPQKGEWTYGVNLFAGLMALAGWALTIFAISLGAPFWFDVLNKFIVVRATVKPTEKSPNEPSKDASAQPSAGKMTAVGGGADHASGAAGAAVIESHSGFDVGDLVEIQALDPHSRPRDDEHA